jgi:hypothetical protein
MIENAARRSVALLIAGLAVFGTVGALQAAAAEPQHGAVLAVDTDPSDPVGICQLTRGCWQ